MSNSGFKSYKPSHVDDDVKGLVEKIVKSKVRLLERQDLGEVNAVYFIKTEDGQECVVRVAPEERGGNSFRIETLAFNMCRKVGVPTPEVIALDDSLEIFPEAFMITKKIDGTAGHQSWSTDAEGASLIKQLGHFLSLIHGIKLDGFGREPQVKNGQLVGKFNSQWESLVSDLDAPWREEVLVGKGLLSDEKVQKYRRLFDENKKLFDLPHASLLHGDASLKNTIVKDRRIVGIVDMENCMVGDPVQDIAWHHFWTQGAEPFFSALKEGYDNKEIFEGDFMKKMYLYELFFAQSILGYYDSRSNPEMVKTLQAKIGEIETSFESIK
ncbi:MAG TPA: phosphotransferase [Patescibacteria group bacterium]|nr:phosphotransferase [Patescibacteria group bacterium]